MAKTTVALDNEIVQSLLQGDLTCLQSVVKDLIEHALETKAEEILQACLLQTKNGHQEVRTKCTKRTVSRSMPC